MWKTCRQLNNLLRVYQWPVWLLQGYSSQVSIVLAYLFSLYMEQSWNPSTWWEPTWLEFFWCILTLGKWKITPVYHAMKFGADFGIFCFFSVLWEYHCFCHLKEEWESAQQAVSSIIQVQRNSEIKIKSSMGNNEPKSLMAKIRFQENFDYSKNFPNQLQTSWNNNMGNFSLTKG